MVRMVIRKHKGSEFTTHEDFKAAIRKLPSGVYSVSGLSRGWGTSYDVTAREMDLAVREGILLYHDEIVPSQRFSEFMRSQKSQVDRPRKFYFKRGE
jgi:hypothetical protein